MEVDSTNNWIDVTSRYSHWKELSCNANGWEIYWNYDPIYKKLQIEETENLGWG